jgi:hypothetical protein
VISTTLLVYLLAQSESAGPPQTGRGTVGDTKVTYLFGAVLPKEARWQPLTREQRWQLYWRNTWANPGIAFRTLMPAAIGQLNNEPPEWGQGVAGYARRAGSSFGTFTVGDTLRAGIAAGMGYDVRYLRCQCDGAWPRLRHAWKQVFITKNREGQWRPNYPVILSRPAASAISIYGWMPDSQRTTGNYLQSVAFQFGFPLAFNPLVEFGPEIRKIFRRK